MKQQGWMFFADQNPVHTRSWSQEQGHTRDGAKNLGQTLNSTVGRDATGQNHPTFVKGKQLWWRGNGESGVLLYSYLRLYNRRLCSLPILVLSSWLQVKSPPLKNKFRCRRQEGIVLCICHWYLGWERLWLPVVLSLGGWHPLECHLLPGKKLVLLHRQVTW